MKKIKLLLGLSVMMAFGACTVEKRRYTDGYHVEWNRSNGKGVVAKSSDLATNNQTTQTILAESQAAVSEEVIVAEQHVVTPALKSDTPVSAKADNKEKRNQKQVVLSARPNHGLKAGLFKDFNRGTVQTFSAQPLSGGAETDTVLLVILAILLPPLAVYLYEGSWTSRCTVNLILTLLCGLPGVIHALVIILGNK